MTANRANLRESGVAGRACLHAESVCQRPPAGPKVFHMFTAQHTG